MFGLKDVRTYFLVLHETRMDGYVEEGSDGMIVFFLVE